MEKIYDCRGRFCGYVKDCKVCDNCCRLKGYTDGCTIYDVCGKPLAYVDRGCIYSTCGKPLGTYDGRNNRVYDMCGCYLGCSNGGYKGLLGAILLLLLLRPSGRYYY